MFLAYLTMLTALTISAVAIYYSVSGLAAIFAAAVIPIIIMGGVLETAKLVTAVWLHRYWEQAKWWLKGYLSIAVLILMFITSMGIFGFLSKAHIEQTSMSTEQTAQIQTLEENLARSQSRVDRWNEELDRLLNGGGDFRVDSILTSTQNELNDLYARIDTDKERERELAQEQIAQQNTRLEQAGNRKTQDLEAAVRQREQALEAAEKYNTGGLLNNQTQLYTNAVTAANETYDARVKSIEDQELSVASSAQREIRNINNTLNTNLSDIDERYATQVNRLVTRIDELRADTTNKTDDVDQRIDELESLVQTEQNQMGTVREEKAVLESQYRMLEAEVGPVKYIAEFIYGEEADNNLLEEAVRWVIIVIIFVFDPLAVLLLIASQYTFEFHRKKFGFTFKPEDDPEGPDGLGKPEPKSNANDLPSAVDDAATAMMESASPKQPYNMAIHEKLEEDEQLRDPELDFSALQDKIDETRKAFEDWYAENPSKISAEEEVSDENILVSEPEPEPEPEVNVEVLDLTADSLLPSDGKLPTDGKTYQKVLGSDYIIDLEGKQIHKDALKTQHPDLFLKIDDDEGISTGFGTEFPKLATKGDIFVRVDQMPNRVYKFEGHKWMEINKENTQTYIFDEEYIKYLVAKIETGEYDLDLLSEKEKAEIEEYLLSQQTAQNG